MDSTSSLSLSGSEVMVLGGMLAVLTGAISALWFAYSRAMQQRIDTQQAYASRLQGIVLDALALVSRIFDKADGNVVTAQDKEDLRRLREEVRSKEAP